MFDLQRPRLQLLHRELAAEIPCEPEEARSDLCAMPLSTLLIHYMNWTDRLVPPRPRRVLAWSGFPKSAGVRQHAAVLARLQRRIEAGEDLRPFLSERVARCGYVRPRVDGKGKRRGIEWEDKDYALNVHEVHHLHISDTILPNGWSVRTDALLYAQFDREAAGLVMVGDHRSFDDGSLAAAIAAVRAEGGETVKGATGEALPHKVRNRMQRHGVMTMVPVGNQVVHGGLFTSAGTSLYHLLYAQHAMRMIETQEPLLDDPATLRGWFDQGQLKPPPQPDIAWAMHHGDFGVFERSTGTFFNLLFWRR